eukprot:9489738-Pyramimonas_sp.AAC.1
MSPKSVVVCTKFQDAREIVRRVKAFDFSLKAAPQPVDLGCDLGGGPRHARANRASRQKKHSQMSKK